jgi:GNAT superfamily N-acetyltransferase
MFLMNDGILQIPKHLNSQTLKLSNSQTFKQKDMNFTIRKGTKVDVPAAYKLIIELAIYEKEPDAVSNTIEKMYEDGFGENPIYGFYVAEHEGEIVAMALYYFRYSTWKGKRLFLEDLIVTEKYRGNGLGELMLQKMIEEAHSTKCTGLMWQVLDWNEPAINFYNKFGVRYDKGWYNVHLDF